MRAAFEEIRRRAARRGPWMRARVWQRWTGTPFEAVAAHVPTHGTVLDLGCGFGMFSALLALRSPTLRVIGLDGDPGRIAVAQALFGDLVSFSVFDLASPAALPDADVSVFYDVLHHLPDADAALRKVRSPRLVVKENDVVPLPKHLVSLAIEAFAVGTSFTPSAPVRMRGREAWTSAITAAGYQVHHAEHLRATHGFFVPHALFVAQRHGD